MSEVPAGISFGITSDFVKARGAFKKGPQEIVVYVEGYKDVSFWKKMFSDRGVLVCPKAYAVDSDANGKDTIIRDIRNGTLKLGEFLLVALDSDYDYLLDNNSDIYNNAYVFQTYSYAIENLMWHPDKLDNICQTAASCTHHLGNSDIKKVLQAWSNAVYPAFIALLEQPKVCSESVTRLVLDINTDDIQFNYSSLSYPPISNTSFAKQLAGKGLNCDTVFLFIQGHDLENRLDQLCLKLVEEASMKMKAELITQHGEKNSGQHIGEYMNSRHLPSKLVINDPIQCDICVPKIVADISNYTTLH
ncbi:DUF4435 domain-containing protein [Vibrio parahaemolyticus]|nr:DUF4435 domain-containing protein [Vibrio parahaemolyticus]HCG7546134.1 DUF4435 domain-containing protein [Vibrio parahaemolyticus]